MIGNLLLEVGNMLFFMAGFPQLIRTLKMIRKKQKMIGVSSSSFVGYALGCICFAGVGIIFSSFLTTTFNLFNLAYFSIVAWWSRKK